MRFKEWLLSEHATRPGAKMALYPISYGGIGLYTVPDYMNWAADAVTYIPPENRFLKFKWGKGILANPFGKDELYSRIENKMTPQVEIGHFKGAEGGLEKTSPYVRIAEKPRARKTEIVSRNEVH